MTTAKMKMKKWGRGDLLGGEGVLCGDEQNGEAGKRYLVRRRLMLD
jgi:hypothetical protein